MSQRADQPTSRQLCYLRVLAERTATTFASPNTRAEASREIRRLKARPAISSGERRRERRMLDANRERLQPSSAVDPREISGYGPHARWCKR